jgi:S-methyl-5-thioribose kinase
LCCCRELLVKFTNPDLCALTEQVIFQDPYTDTAINRHTSPQLDAAAADLRADVPAKAAAFKLKQKFCQNAEALIHGDLHTGSIMVRGGVHGNTCHVLSKDRFYPVINDATMMPLRYIACGRQHITT